MVVCKLVRITNTSSRIFYLQHSGDPWYTPRIGDTEYGGGQFIIPPGFDAEVKDLVIPWAAISSFFAELVFGEVGRPGQVKCVVGPGEECSDIDFVRLHASSWEALLGNLWLPLGHRHLRGAVAPVDVTLVFRDVAQSKSAPSGSAQSSSPKRGSAQSSSAPASALADVLADARVFGATGGYAEPDVLADAVEAFGVAESMRFEHCLTDAPKNTILLNVFDLAAATATLNAMLCNSVVKSFGAFHTAVEVYGKEFSFYQSGRGDPDACGICRSAHPRSHPHHVYRQSIVMGTTDLSEKEVMQAILSIADDWPSKRYNIVRCNCIHFCHILLQRLGMGPVPRWVTGLHEIGEVAVTLINPDGPANSSPEQPEVQPVEDEDFFWAPAGFTPVEEGRGLGLGRSEAAEEKSQAGKKAAEEKSAT